MKIRDTIMMRVASSIADSGLSMSEIGRRLDVSPQAVYNWSASLACPSAERIERLAKILNRDPVWLSGRRETEVEEDRLAEKSTVEIPLIDAKASCGTGLENFDYDQPLKMIEVDPDWLVHNVRARDCSAIRAITISGDSMSPTLEDGEFVLIDTSIQTTLTDSIYLATVNGSLYIKRFQRSPNGSLLMISDNPRYEKFTLSEGDNIQILGRLVYHWRGERL